MSSRAFRDALGRFATGVTIVTAAGPDDELIGVTVSSFNSVSLDPPLILFSIDLEAMSLPALLAAPGYAISVLSADQSDLSNHFARQSSDKWTGVEYEIGRHGAPLPRGTIASFECDRYATHEGGDHTIFVGRVARHRAGPARPPLLFFGGRYREIAAEPDQE